MLKRNAERDITDWLKHGTKALLVDGARQVGKTYTIRQCLKDFGTDYVEINLIDDTDAAAAIAKARTVEDLMINLSAATGHHFIKGETVIFIDEVQEQKEIVTRIKFWVDEGSFRFVLSGSLLGVEINDIRSAPVGYVHEIKMYPMDFMEFAAACGVTEEVFRHIEKCFLEKTPVGEVVHQKMMQLFQRYMVVGGMPQAVQAFVESGDIGNVGEIQKDIISYYKKDFAGYESMDAKLMLEEIYDRVPAQLLKQNRRFNYADIKKGLRYERIEKSFLWLYKAGVLLHAFHLTEPRMALKLNEKSSLVKLYYADVGLLTYACGDAMRRDILYGEGKANLGGIYENAIIQELCAKGFDVYYYNSKKLGELDFVIEYHGHILPIEVKCGKDYYVHSAVNHVLDNDDFGIPEAMIFTGFDLSTKGNITYLPVYMSAFLKKELELPVLEPLSF